MSVKSLMILCFIMLFCFFHLGISSSKPIVDKDQFGLNLLKSKVRRNKPTISSNGPKVNEEKSVIKEQCEYDCMNMYISSKDEEEESCYDDLGNNKEYYEHQRQINNRIANIYLQLLNPELEKFDTEFKNRIEDDKNKLHLTVNGPEDSNQERILADVVNYCISDRTFATQMLNKITQSGKVDEIYLQLDKIKKEYPGMKSHLWKLIEEYIGKPKEILFYEKDNANMILCKTDPRLILHMKRQRNKIAEFAAYSYLYGPPKGFQFIINQLEKKMDDLEDDTKSEFLNLPRERDALYRHLAKFSLNNKKMIKLFNYHLDQIIKSKLSFYKLEDHFKIEQVKEFSKTLHENQSYQIYYN